MVKKLKEGGEIINEYRINNNSRNNYSYRLYMDDL